ncbi:hypothetical protein EW146_g5328 [Bondarzewia mesenterica]|uniref:Uncharacterized protein n=1 Tax=Bondarzewia mesenterica TaxID=1095465 RepID=A0A4S4LRS7_9AGAM|nr:hypothetical protein EW146_g5328 [Bondarzewia mesenterica]
MATNEHSYECLRRKLILEVALVVVSVCTAILAYGPELLQEEAEYDGRGDDHSASEPLSTNGDDEDVLHLRPVVRDEDEPVDREMRVKEWLQRLPGQSKARRTEDDAELVVSGDSRRKARAA